MSTEPRSAAEMTRDEIEMLRARVARFEEFAKAHEAWEANILNDAGPEIDEILNDDFERIQRLRNKAMKS